MLLFLAVKCKHLPVLLRQGEQFLLDIPGRTFVLSEVSQAMGPQEGSATGWREAGVAVRICTSVTFKEFLGRLVGWF